MIERDEYSSMDRNPLTDASCVINTSEADERARVVTIAQRWKGTPYRHRAKVRGAGADCATLVVAVFEQAGLIPPQDLPAYSPQWHENKDFELYLSVIMKYCREIEGPPQPGDLVMWKFGKVLSHGAIVVAWPRIIHAMMGEGVVFDDALANQRLQFVGVAEADHGKPRERHFYSYWAGRDA